jgi:hypothetical protein
MSAKALMDHETFVKHEEQDRYIHLINHALQCAIDLTPVLSVGAASHRDHVCIAGTEPSPTSPSRPGSGWSRGGARGPAGKRRCRRLPAQRSPSRAYVHVQRQRCRRRNRSGRVTAHGDRLQCAASDLCLTAVCVRGRGEGVTAGQDQIIIVHAY